MVRMPVTVFHSTSTRHIPQKYPISFGMMTTVFLVHSYAKFSYLKSAWTMETTLYQFFGYRVSSLVSA